MRLAFRISAAAAAAPPLHNGVSAAAHDAPTVANLLDRARHLAELPTGSVINLYPTIMAIHSLGPGSDDLELIMQLQLEQPQWFAPTCHHELAVIEEWAGELMEG